MKFTKTLALFALTSLFAVSAFATSYQTMWLGQKTYLDECGGTMKATKSANNSGDQVNLVFKKVSMCSNFDILGANGERLQYPNQKLQGKDGNRSGSFTIPARFIDWGKNYITVVVKSNSGKHEDKVTVKFYAY